MSDAVTVRDAVADDIAAITAIYAHHVLTGTATFEIDPPDAAEMARRWRQHADHGWPYLVAERGDVVVGYAYAAQFRDRAAYSHTAETSIYLDHRGIRRGVGRILLGALLERGTDCGFDQFVAVIGDSANAASIGLHAACGFGHAGVLTAVGRKFGRALDVVYMQRGTGTGGETASF
ncbi:GNAT family N-acetyltransferase [Sphingosinicellaceae bacterium]|nr:GNAT family N-acetyltransferase [Sphingosinicellaceae bacterium]